MMSNLTSRQIIATNLRMLMDRNKHSQGYLHLKTGLSQSTIGRTLSGESSATVDTLDDLAKVYGLQPWQMLIAGLEANNPPVLKNMSKIEQEFYEKMNEAMAVLQQSK